MSGQAIVVGSRVLVPGRFKNLTVSRIYSIEGRVWIRAEFDGGHGFVEQRGERASASA